MTVKTIGDFTFNCDSHNRRDGFNHTAVLYYTGKRLSTNTCKYYNRTYELYDYQSAMIGAVKKVISRTKDQTFKDELQTLLTDVKTNVH